MESYQYSVISYYFALVIFATFPLMLTLIIAFPSPPFCDALPDIGIAVNGMIGLVGSVFAIVGIKEKSSFKKRFGLVTNAFFFAGLILNLMS